MEQIVSFITQKIRVYHYCHVLLFELILFFFAVKKYPSETSIYLSVSTIEPGIKSEISGIMWQVAPESKIQLVSCKLSPKYLIGLSALEEICATDAYILRDSFCHVMFDGALYIFVNLYARVLGFSVF